MSLAKERSVENVAFDRCIPRRSNSKVALAVVIKADNVTGVLDDAIAELPEQDGTTNSTAHDEEVVGVGVVEGPGGSLNGRILGTRASSGEKFCGHGLGGHGELVLDWLP